MQKITNQAIILFAHGSRSIAWRQPFDKLLQLLKDKYEKRQNINNLYTHIDLAFLEIMKPSLPEAIHNSISLGYTQINICPIFLGKGGHIQHDLPKIIQEIKQSYKDIEVNIIILPFIGERDSILQAIILDIENQIN